MKTGGGSYMKKITVRQQRRNDRPAQLLPVSYPSSPMLDRLNQQILSSPSAAVEPLTWLKAALTAENLKDQLLALRRAGSLLGKVNPMQEKNREEEAAAAAEGEKASYRVALETLTDMFFDTTVETEPLLAQLVLTFKAIPKERKRATQQQAGNEAEGEGDQREDTLYPVLLSIFSQRLVAFLSQLSVAPSGQQPSEEAKAKRFSRLLFTLYNALEAQPLLVDSLSSNDSASCFLHLRQLLSFLSGEILARCAPQLQRKEATSPLVIRECELALKTIIMTLHRFAPQLRLRFRHSFFFIDPKKRQPEEVKEESKKGEDEYLIALIREISHNLLAVMKGRNSDRDLVGPAAFCLCSLVQQVADAVLLPQPPTTEEGEQQKSAEEEERHERSSQNMKNKTKEGEVRDGEAEQEEQDEDLIRATTTSSSSINRYEEEDLHRYQTELYWHFFLLHDGQPPLLLALDDAERPQTTSSSSLQPSMDWFWMNKLLPQEENLREVFLSLPLISKLAVYRGLIINLPLQVLTTPFHSPLPSSQQDRKTLLWDFLFPVIIELCNRSAAGKAIRGFAFQILDATVRTIKTVLTTAFASSSSSLSEIVHQETIFGATVEDFFSSFAASILNMLFTNWADPNESIVTQVTKIFDCFLEVYDLFAPGFRAEGSTSAHKYFMLELADRLLRAESHRKAKYTALQLLINRMGASRIVKEISSDFLQQLLPALAESSARSAAARVIDSFLISLKQEAEKDEANNNASSKVSVEAAHNKCRTVWLLPVVTALCTEEKALRHGMMVYALPSILQLFPGDLHHILSAIVLSEGKEKKTDEKEEHNGLTAPKLRALISVLNTARKMDLLDSHALETMVLDSSAATSLSVASLLRIALVDEDQELRGDALDMLCNGRRSTELPTRFEMALVKYFLWHNIKSSSASLRQSLTPKVGKFLTRLRDVERAERKKKVEERKKHRKQGTASPHEPSQDSGLQSDVKEFFEWLCVFLTGAMYPGAPFQRKMTALSLYQELTNVCCLVPKKSTELIKLASSTSASSEVTNKGNKPELVNIFSEGTSSVLVASLWDDIDNMRQLAYSTVAKFPAPLPGFENPSQFCGLLRRGIAMTCSPRARETDTGANVLRLVLSKYVRQLGWYVNLCDASGAIAISCSTDASLFAATEPTATPAQHFFQQMLLLLDSHIAVASRNLLEASQLAPMHGPLLAIRYMMQDINFKEMLPSSEITLTRVPSSTSGGGRRKKDASPPLSSTDICLWRSILEGLLQRLKRVSELVLEVVSMTSPEGLTSLEDLPENYFETEGESEGNTTMIGAGSPDFVGPKGQFLSVCSWLSIKEVALLLGSVGSIVPLPTPAQAEPFIKEEMVGFAGDLFLDILLQCRHRGALEKSYMGLQVLTENLLSCDNPRLHDLPHRWIDRLLATVTSTEFKSTTRRSAGLPYSFSAILRAESIVLEQRRGGSKVLVGKVVQGLLALVGSKQEQGSAEQEGPKKVVVDDSMKVHALNVLRMLLRDSALRFEVMPYLMDALVLCIEGYTSPNWGIRNSSTMTFSVLVERIVAPKLVRDEHSRKNSATFAQFFAKHPKLYPYLLQKLQAEMSLQPQTKKQEQSAQLYSSLYPVLVLLSKLTPSQKKRKTIVEEKNKEKDLKTTDGSATFVDTNHPVKAAASPSAFIPVVLRCASEPNFKVRQMAARALVPLLSLEDVPVYLKLLVDSVPDASGQRRIRHNSVHGTLLQIHQLVVSHLLRENALEPEAQQQLINESLASLVAGLKDKLWLLSAEVECVPVKTALLDVLCAILPLTHHQDKTLFGSSLASVVRELLFPKVTTANADDPQQQQLNHLLVMSSLLRSSAAGLCLHALLSPVEKSIWKEQVGDMVPVLVSLLRDSSYEVRLTALKFLRRDLLHCPQLSQFDLAPVQQELLASFIKGDSYPVCTKNVLRLLRELPLEFPVAALLATDRAGLLTAVTTSLDVALVEDSKEVFSNLPLLWRRLYFNMVGTTHNASIKEEVITFMGFYLRHCMSVCFGQKKGISETELQTMLKQWMALLHINSTADMPFTMRKAVVISIRESSICLPKSLTTPNVLDDSVMEAWGALVRLLQDDEEEVRQEAAALVTKASRSLSSPSPSMLQGQGQGLCVTDGHALLLAFDYLAERFLDSPPYLNFLLRLLLPANSSPTPMEGDSDIKNDSHPSSFDTLLLESQLLSADLRSNSNAATGSGSTISSSLSLHATAAANKLFEKEADNWYEEELVQVQAAAKSLERALVGGITRQEEDGEETRRWRVWFVEEGGSICLRAAEDILVAIVELEEKGGTEGRWAVYEKRVFVGLLRLFYLLRIMLLVSNGSSFATYQQSLIDGWQKVLTTAQRVQSMHPMVARALEAVQEHPAEEFLGLPFKKISHLFLLPE